MTAPRPRSADGRPEWQARMEDAEQKCDEARAAIRRFIADYEASGSLPNYPLNRLRRVLDSKTDPRSRCIHE